MIPKVIHYCWFGNKKMPDLAVKCLESWKKNCPDYKIVKWSEENFDINICNYVREAYESEKYAFVRLCKNLCFGTFWWYLYGYRCRSDKTNRQISS